MTLLVTANVGVKLADCNSSQFQIFSEQRQILLLQLTDLATASSQYITYKWAMILPKITELISDLQWLVENFWNVQNTCLEKASERKLKILS